MSVASGPARVLVVRGHQANPWELRPWEQLPERFAVSYLATARNRFDRGLVRLSAVPARTIRDFLPAGRAGDLAVRVPGDRYLAPTRLLAGHDIVHAQELGYWYSDQAARLKRRLGYRLVLTVWETIPFAGAYRNVRTRPYRRRVLAAADLFLATTERARAALLLEGADPSRIRVSPPGVDLERFGAARYVAPAEPPLLISAGRLVWEKGHQDAIRAVAAIRSGVVEAPARARRARLLVVGSGPEDGRLRAYARDLGVDDAVEFRTWVPYEQMPQLLGGASALVLASLSLWSWEEQFGMVLAEAMAAGLPVAASTSGAIPEVLAGQGRLFAPGDWLGLARILAAGPLAAAGGAGAAHDPAVVERYGSQAAAARLAAAYDELLAPG